MTRTASEIEAWLQAYLGRELAVAPEAVGLETPFSDLGVGSRQAVIMAGDLEDWLGIELDAAMMWEHPTVKALAAHLAR